MKQKGFTLIEVLVVSAITGVIVLVIGASFTQLMQGREDINQKSVAITDIDSSAHWLTRDLVLAQTTVFTSASNMTLSWTDKTSWALDEGTITHQVNYALSGTRLIRTYDGEVTIVGRYLTQANFSLAGNLFTLTLTSCPGLPGSAITRSFKIEMRFDPPT